MELDDVDTKCIILDYIKKIYFLSECKNTNLYNYDFVKISTRLSQKININENKNFDSILFLLSIKNKNGILTMNEKIVKAISTILIKNYKTLFKEFKIKSEREFMKTYQEIFNSQENCYEIGDFSKGFINDSEIFERRSTCSSLLSKSNDLIIKNTNIDMKRISYFSKLNLFGLKSNNMKPKKSLLRKYCNK